MILPHGPGERSRLGEIFHGSRIFAVNFIRTPACVKVFSHFTVRCRIRERNTGIRDVIVD